MHNNITHGLAILTVEDTIEEAAQVVTEDGSITFAYPEPTLAGEDVLANDTYRKVDGELQYRYDIRVRDLPEAGPTNPSSPQAGLQQYLVKAKNSPS